MKLVNNKFIQTNNTIFKTSLKHFYTNGGLERAYLLTFNQTLHFIYCSIALRNDFEKSSQTGKCLIFSPDKFMFDFDHAEEVLSLHYQGFLLNKKEH